MHNCAQHCRFDPCKMPCRQPATFVSCLSLLYCTNPGETRVAETYVLHSCSGAQVPTANVILDINLQFPSNSQPLKFRSSEENQDNCFCMHMAAHAVQYSLILWNALPYVARGQPQIAAADTALKTDIAQTVCCHVQVMAEMHRTRRLACVLLHKYKIWQLVSRSARLLGTTSPSKKASVWKSGLYLQTLGSSCDHLDRLAPNGAAVQAQLVALGAQKWEAGCENESSLLLSTS